MKEQILVIDDHNTLPLTSLTALYPCLCVTSATLKADVVKEMRVAVIVADNETDAWIQANSLRLINPMLPLLFVSEYREPQLSLLRVLGCAPVRILYIHADDADQLLHDVQALMHPEYPASNRRIAIVLPVYNEAGRFENVLNFTTKLRQSLAVSYPHLSIFFVNDGSKDRTQELVDRIIDDENASSHAVSASSPLAAHNLEYNTRKAGTYIEAIKSIRADIILFADADDSFTINDIASMINILQDGYWDMVIGTKDDTAEGRSPMRRMMSFVKRLLTRPLLPKGVVDSQTGLKAFSGTAAAHILPYLHESMGLAIDLEMVHIARKLNFRVLQIPVQCIDRDGSHVDVVHDSLRFLRSIVLIWAANRSVTPNTTPIRSLRGNHA